MRVAIGAVLGSLITLGTMWVLGPHCPTEDSCGYGWDNGPKIVEVTP